MRYGEILRSTLEEFKITQSWLAQASGVDEAQISKVLSGERDLYGDNLLAIIKALPPNAFRHFWKQIQAVERLTPNKQPKDQKKPGAAAAAQRKFDPALSR